MSAELWYTPGLPAEARAAIEPHLVQWAFLIPAWCHRVNVVWTDDDANGALKVQVHYEYRRADLHVLPNFLSATAHREEQVIHELLHIATEPMRNTCHDLRDALVAQIPALAGWADELMRHSEESVVCDLAAAIVRARVGEWGEADRAAFAEFMRTQREGRRA